MLFRSYGASALAAGWFLNTAAGGSISATTDGFGDNNDILITSPSAISVNANAVNIFGNNGDAAVIFETYAPNSGVITFRSGTSNQVIDSLSGIQFVFSGHGPDTDGIVFNVGGDMSITAWEKRGSIFFQSDTDTVMEANTISHTEIAARLGFFSVTDRKSVV